MAKPAAASPQLNRKAVLAEMLEATQQVAQKIDSKLRRLSIGEVLIAFDIGSLIHQVVINEGVYGPDAVRQIAGYVGISGGDRTLYDLRRLATEFEREFVEQEAARPMANGRYISRSHFMLLARVSSAKSRKRLLKRVRAQCLSAAELQREITASREAGEQRSGEGGRKLKPPPTPRAGLKRLTQDAERMAKYVAVLEESVFDGILEMSASEIDENLLEQIKQTEVGATNAIRHLQHAIDRLREGKGRVERILAREPKPQEQHAEVHVG